jgi:hypothetical protein
MKLEFFFSRESEEEDEEQKQSCNSMSKMHFIRLSWVD